MAASPAVPSSINIHNMAGTYTLNKTLSSPTDAVLKMQGVGWLVRQAVAYSAVTVTLKQYTDAEEKVHIDIDQVSTGGIRALHERTADWQWREKDDKIFGKLKGRTRLIKLDEVDGEGFLKEEWEEACMKGDVVENEVQSLSGGWKAHQVWGFMEMDGARRWVQKVVTGKSADEEFKVKMVYDWKV